MNTGVDLSQLALDRGTRAGRRQHLTPGRQVLTRYLLPGTLLLGCAVLITWACRHFLWPPQPVQVVPVLASRAEIQQEGRPLFKAAGWVEPRPTPVRVAALTGGVVEQLLVVEDQPVKVGQPIAELLKEDARLIHERAQADLKLREAELQGAQAALTACTSRFEQPVHLEASLAEAEAELATVQARLTKLPSEIRQAEAQRAYAEQNHMGKAGAGGAVSGRAVARAKSEYESAQAFLEGLSGQFAALRQQQTALVQRRDALQKQLELRADERRAKEEAAAAVQVASARLEQARVALAVAQLQVDRTTVRSPADGRVLRLVAQPGSQLMVGPGHDASHDASTVVTLYRPDHLQVRVDVRFEDLRRVQIGQPVSISSPALAAALRGKVLIISSEADIQKNTLEVKVAIDLPAPDLKPEMLVDVTFLAPKVATPSASPSDELRLFVQQQLVRQDPAGTFVWVADQSAGVARQTPIELGAAGSDGLVEVTKGLNMASRLIAAGHNDLRDGQRIRVTGEAGELTTVLTE